MNFLRVATAPETIASNKQDSFASLQNAHHKADTRQLKIRDLKTQKKTKSDRLVQLRSLSTTHHHVSK